MDTTPGTETEDTGERKDKGGRGCGCWIVVLLILLGGGAATGLLMGTMVLRQEKPLPGEREITDLGLRWIAVPGEYADLRIPDRLMSGATRDATLARGRELYGVECSLCHGASGKGDSSLGMLMYPPASDLTASRTQTKSDGQLYWLIAHGVNLTGMPAWGKDYGGPHSEDELWSLVAYIRSLKGQ